MKTLAWLAAAILASVSMRTAAAGGYLYSLNSSGNLSVNGSKINALPGSFDPSAPLLLPEQAWRDLAILDGSRYALRGDGLIYRNGAKLFRLPFDPILGAPWTQLEVVSGTTYALRQDGEIAVSGGVVGSVPPGGFAFASLEVVSNATYSLRSDGAVFKNTGSTPIFTFQAGAGLFGGGDGQEDDTVWIELKTDPTGQYLYGLRTDGNLYRGRISGAVTNGQLVDSFPFPASALDYSFGSLYWDFEFDDVATNWVVLRVNGKVYREPDARQEADDFPGSGNVTDEQFFDLGVYNGKYFALRSDGRVYREGSNANLVYLGGRGYGRIQLSAIAPDLSGHKNIKPAVVQYAIAVNTGLPVKVPVIATDVETPADDLTVTPVSAPSNSVWDAGTRTFTWTASDVIGTYTFSYEVADTGGRTNTYKSKVQVKLPDVVLGKNYPPYVPKLKGAVALVGQECRLYIPLGDPDNDPVTASVDPAAYPFSVGAVYDAMTSEFVWTPTITDIGKRSVAFTLSDGTLTKKLKVQIQVGSPLLIAPLPD